MSDKVYEMYDDYNQAVEKLLNFIKLRDELRDILPTIAPEEEQDFYDRVARLEATNLERIIARADESE
ncbi:hypothetical protein BH10ACI1_BH10ACI1_31570 [soil metagenome]